MASDEKTEWAWPLQTRQHTMATASVLELVLVSQRKQAEVEFAFAFAFAFVPNGCPFETNDTSRVGCKLNSNPLN